MKQILAEETEFPKTVTISTYKMIKRDKRKKHQKTITLSKNTDFEELELKNAVNEIQNSM